MEKPYFVYILRLSNGSLYTGYTDDVLKRLRAHCSGKGSKVARSFPPRKIERVWKTESRSSALRLEAMIKRCSREEKERFVRKPSELIREAVRGGRIDGDIEVAREFSRVKMPCT
ncbi:MAG TPA: GIY-YIG nuclease family protein [Spirochaetota bacterium]|nr:GIY-YIG nuclease family protein [Spirochaetota bacterium]